MQILFGEYIYYQFDNTNYTYILNASTLSTFTTNVMYIDNPNIFEELDTQYNAIKYTTSLTLEKLEFP
ncbi:MAG: hypothetical protein AB8U25_01475 [Rickettsiales endosymbiont of Dermacentor nuttalli]